MAPTRRLALASILAVAGTLAPGAARAAPHVFDLAPNMPPHLAAVFAVNWFGIPASDPQGVAGDGGADPGYGNWRQEFPQCGLSNDPATCAPFADAGLERIVASKRRPLAGIYSSSGRTPESLRRTDLMLATTRTTCGSGARLDAFIIQLDSVRFTSAHPQNQQSGTWDIAYRALLAFLARGDQANLGSHVIVGSDATVYWHFGSAFGLTTQDQRKAALQADIAEMAALAAAHVSAAKLGGRPLLAFYVDAALMTPAEWTAVLEGARAASGVDFYAVATTLDGAFFEAFDALSPWVNLGVWANAQAGGGSLHDEAVAYATEMHKQLFAGVRAYPGRVVFGGVAPGFDDYTQNWGACTARELPRDPAVLQGQMDYLASKKAAGADVRGIIVDTWDDWTEGTEIEPDVTEGTAKLEQLRALLGSFYGEPPDPAGDTRLDALWTGFGQARSCCFAGGACVDAGAAPVPLQCAPEGGAGDAGDAGDAGTLPGGDGGALPDAGAVPTVDGGGADAGGGAGSGGSSGCGCATPGAGDTVPLALAAAGGVVVAIAALRRRRDRR